MKAIGEKVVLQGKTYEITGYHKRSYLLKGENGKIYKCGPEKLDRIEAGIPRQAHRRTAAQPSSAVPAYITRQIEYDKRLASCTGRASDLKLPETEAEIMQWFGRLTGELSPENLSCDGELSASATAAKRRELLTAWAWLERKLGRQMTENDYYDQHC